MPPDTFSATLSGVFPHFSEPELVEARRMNRRLMYMPRFRAPHPVAKLMIQSSLRAAQLMAPHGVPGIAIETRRIDWQGQSVPLRILKPDGPVRGVYVDYHGGGWSIGNAAMDDRVNARIVRDNRLAVVSVDYGLLPETPLAAMIDQCRAAADWVFDHAQAEFGADDIFIGGESAGAHLAACTALRLRARKDFARLKGAVLFYGPYDLSCTPSVRAARADTLVLNGPAMVTGLARLVPGSSEAQRQHPDLSPLYADLSGLPPALFVCGTLDPLIDDSKLMAERWRKANGNVQLMIVPEAPHAFNRFFTRMASRTNAYVRGWIETRLPVVAKDAVAAE